MATPSMAACAVLAVNACAENSVNSSLWIVKVQTNTCVPYALLLIFPNFALKIIYCRFSFQLNPQHICCQKKATHLGCKGSRAQPLSCLRHCVVGFESIESYFIKSWLLSLHDPLCLKYHHLHKVPSYFADPNSNLTIQNTREPSNRKSYMHTRAHIFIQ